MIFASFRNRLVQSRIWRSFFRHGWPDNPLDRSLAMTSNVFFHLHPVKISRKSLKWSYTFGLGTISAILLGELVFTGVLLMFYYVPSLEGASGPVHTQHAPLGSTCNGHHGDLAYGAGLLHRSLQTTA
jgi:quinol-cytochrome oxidoreductase complex cytochrome b subunit